tara:strand:+ start:635 stop:1783 length:1149 start_codon:yes stop_codon:yes gene_type:complete
MSYTLADYKWGFGEKGHSGGTVAWSFASAGAGSAFARDISNPYYQALIRDAFQAWEDNANIDFVEVADGAQSDLRLGWDNIDGAYGVIGTAQSYYSRTTSTLYSVIEAEIRFDLAENWSTSKTPAPSAVNLYTTALHEIGHTMGLLHTDDPGTIMYPTLMSQPDLTQHDIQGAQIMYGARVWGTAQDDLLAATHAADIIDGQAGIDTVRFEGALSLYSITDDNNLNIDVYASDTGLTHALKNVERLQFDNGYLAFDTDGNAGTAYRLYQAAFDRSPDPEGLGFWLRHFDTGTVNLEEMAGHFIRSEEFDTKYGGAANVDDNAFLTLLYNNILDRDPDQAGFDFWENQQENGLSRSSVLQHFSDSQENIAKVAAAIDDGIWYV